MSPSEVTQVLAQLQAGYPRERLTAARVRLYGMLLQDLELEAALAAVLRVIARSPFFPSVSEIRDEYARDQVPGTEPELAWGVVLAEVRRVGRSRPPRFDDELVAQAVDAIGWGAICESRTDDGAIRAQFREAYRACAGRARRDVQVPAIARTQEQRRRLGGAVPIAALLGNGSEGEG